VYVQACSYSIPAWALGLLLSQGIAFNVISDLEASVEVPLNKRLTSTAIIYASVLGLVIPFLAALFPIRNALRVNLQKALDLRHSKTVAVKFTIERARHDRFVIFSMFFGDWLVVHHT